MIESKTLTKERIEEIKKFSHKNSNSAPQLTPEQIARLNPGLYTVKPVKKAISIKIDADVLEALKASGKGYQTRINAILRAAVLPH